jgi:hypothetical protein
MGVGLLAAVSSSASANIDSASAQLSDVGRRAFEQIATCLNAEGQSLNVLYLLDESSSLKGTDRDAARADVLAQSIGQLGEIAKSRDVNLAVSTFALTYAERIPWTKLDAATTKQQVQWARQTVPGLNEGTATNWLDALNGGLKSMAEAPQAEGSCDVVIWLTDGGINVADPPDGDIDVKAMAAICGTDPLNGEPTGESAVVNAYRTANVHLIGVLLRNDEYLAALAQQNPVETALNIARMTYMRPITEGSGEVDAEGFVLDGSRFDYTCGTNPIPDDQAAGALLVASDPVGLVLQFSSLASRIGGAQTSPVANSDPQTFVIDSGIDAFDVQFADGEWLLVSPDGQALASNAKAPEAGDVQVTKSGGVITVAVRNRAVSAGAWTLERGPQPSPAFVYVYANLKLVLAAPDVFAGEPAQVILTVTRIDGSPVDLSVYDKHDVSVSVGSGPSDRQEMNCSGSAEQGEYRCSFTPEAVGDQTVRATLEAVTDGGASFRFQGDFPLSVKPTPEFPSVSPASITLSDLDGRRGVAKGTMTLVGPAKGSGQVCFPTADQVSITRDPLPERIGNYTFSGAPWGSCIDLAQGQSADVEIGIANSEAASGEVAGSLPLTLKSGSSDRELSQPVNFTFITIRQGTPNLWIVLLLAALGILVPVGALYLQSFFASRLRLRRLQSATVPVRVKTAGGVTRIERSTPLEPGSQRLIGLSDWAYLPASVDRPRSWSAPAGVTLKGLMPRNPLGPIRAAAIAPSGSCVVSSEGTDGNGSLAPIGLSPVGQFYLVAVRGSSGEDEEFPAYLVAFLGAQEVDIEAASNELAVQVAVPERLTRLVQVSGAAESAKPSKKPDARKGKSKAPEPPATQTSPSTTSSDPFGSAPGSSPGSGVPTSDPFGQGRGSSTPPGQASAPPPDEDPFRQR